jgi:hypothetical protein
LIGLHEHLEQIAQVVVRDADARVRHCDLQHGVLTRMNG